MFRSTVVISIKENIPWSPGFLLATHWGFYLFAFLEDADSPIIPKNIAGTLHKIGEHNQNVLRKAAREVVEQDSITLLYITSNVAGVISANLQLGRRAHDITLSITPEGNYPSIVTQIWD